LHELSQDEDVLDTWFSSWLWPFEVFQGLSKPGNSDIQYYYPTNTLVTAPEIIFFWVARMIMAGMEYMHAIPFSDVYFTGIVRDKLGRKMSKSLGNSPDLLMLIDKYGADAVRFGIMISSPAGNDLLFDESSLEQGSHFNNKLWNALKLLKMWNEKQSVSAQDPSENFAVTWFENRLHEARETIEKLYAEFKLSEILKIIYSLTWDDFCSWYLEWIKPGFEQPVDSHLYHKTIGLFDELLELLHPFMPFITEEIYHSLQERKNDLCIKQLKPFNKADKKILQQGAMLKEIISSIRDAKNKNQLKPKDKITLFIQTEAEENYTSLNEILSRQLNAEIHFTHHSHENTIIITIEKDKFYIQTENKIDTTGIKTDLLKDLDYQKNFLQSVLKKN